MHVEPYFRDLLLRRAERLVKQLQIGSPIDIIGREAILVFEAGVALFPDMIGELSDSLSDLVRRKHGFCPSCGGHVSASLLCETCQTKEIKSHEK